MALGLTQPLTEMSTMNLSRPARKPDLTAAVSRLSGKCGSLDVSELCGPSRPVTEIAVSFFLTIFYGYTLVISRMYSMARWSDISKSMEIDYGRQRSFPANLEHRAMK
jgi:hypothetical protein